MGGIRARSTSGASGAALLAVLLHARALLCECGWVRGEYVVDRAGAPLQRGSGDPLTLVDALNTNEVTATRWEARLLLQKVAGHNNLVEWNAHPYRRAADVQLLLDAAIRELGGVPPRVRIREPRKPSHAGGWSITWRKPA